MSNPWGVSLRKAKPNQDKESPKKKIGKNNSFIARRRSTLKKAPKVEKSLPKKTSSRKFKLKTTPFTISNAPLFGVVLKSVSVAKNESEPAKEQESYLDLEFMDKHRAITSGTQSKQQNTNATTKSKSTPTPNPNENLAPGVPFGVRLKPVRRGYIKEEHRRTWQVDLKPPSNQKKTLAGKYQPESKSFLEIKLRPVKRTKSQIKDGKPEFVQLSLRHVLAPVDGGPKRAVTQATFQIPLLKAVNLEQALSEHMAKARQNVKDPLAEVLQLQLQNLTHVLPKRSASGKCECHTVEIKLNHVDPTTKEIIDLGPAIHVTLKDQPYETSQAYSLNNKGQMPPSMQVALRHVSKEHEEKHEAAPECSKIHLKQPVQVVHEEEEELEEYEEEELDSDSDNYLEDEDMEKLDSLAKEASQQKKRNSLPNMDFEQQAPALVDDKKKKKKKKKRHKKKKKSKEEYEEQVLDDSEYEEEELDDSEYEEEELSDDLHDDAVEYEEYEEYDLVDKRPSGHGLEKPELVRRAKTAPEFGEPDELIVEIEEELLAKDDKKRKKKKKKQGGEEYDEYEMEDDESEYEEYELQDDLSEYEEEEIMDGDPASNKKKKKKKKKRGTKPTQQEPAKDETPETTTPTKGTDPEVTPEVPPPNKEAETEADTPARKARDPARRPPRRTRSSSLSQVDRLRKRREDYLARQEKAAQEQPPKDLTNKKRRDLLMWYNRMKTPKRDEMKRRVAKLPPDCDITPEDVDLLPWLCKGRFLDLKVMNQYFLDDWQGKDEVQQQ